MGARLFRFRKAWQGATHEGIIKTGLSWSWKKRPPVLKRIHQKTSTKLDRLIKQLRRKRVIEKAKFLKWQSRLFTVPKKDSAEDRLILDLSQINLFIHCPSFKMLTLKEVKMLLPIGYWTVSIDLKDGYWHIPVAPNKRPFLGFRYRNQDWQFRAMPFGLNIAPRTFTKVMTQVTKELSQMGIWCLIYLDDLLIIAPTREECINHTQLALQILRKLGLIMNERKSRLKPAQTFEWLGILWNLQNHTAQVSQEKIIMFQEKLKEIVTSHTCSKREVMKLQGLANWIGQCDPIVKLLISTTRTILKLFRKSHPDTIIRIPRNLKIHLCKWVSDNTVPQHLGSPIPVFNIQTDASKGGWGFQVNQKGFHGKFDDSMEYSINVLELLRVWFALLTISVRDSVIQVLSDNTTAVAVLKKAGSINYYLSSLAGLIWRRVSQFNWILKVAHIKGSFNVLADQLSRNKPLSTEWSITPQDFQRILRLNPFLEVDLFATHLNNKLEVFVSPCPDERAVAVDALSISWERWDHLYLYPPTPLISRVLAKLTNTSFKSAILITPELPLRP